MNKKSKTMDFPLEKVSSEGKSVLGQTESSSQPMISGSATSSQFMEEISIFTTVMDIQESFLKNWVNLKDLQNLIKTINGPPKSTTSGFLKKTRL
jgi:hypothetical protein